MMRVLALNLLLFHSTLSKITLPDIVIKPPSDPVPFFQEPPIQCRGLNHVLFEPDSSCYELLSQGPCEPQSWLIIDRISFQAICQPIPCPKYTVFYEGKCEFLEDSGVCPFQAPLRFNIHGEGVCPCQEHQYNDCYPSQISLRTLFTIPCGNGYVMDQQGQCHKTFEAIQPPKRRRVLDDWHSARRGWAFLWPQFRS